MEKHNTSTVFGMKGFQNHFCFTRKGVKYNKYITPFQMKNFIFESRKLHYQVNLIYKLMRDKARIIIDVLT